MGCLPARATLEQLELEVTEHRRAHPGQTRDDARDAVAAVFGHASWERLRYELERRVVLNSCDVHRARALIEREPRWATADLAGWCDHCRGAAPLTYMAMLRFDAPRLGLTSDLSQTGAMAQLLLDAGAPVNGNPGDRETPLMTAASYGGGSALLHAAVFGMTDVLDALVHAGAQARSLAEAAAGGDIDGWLTGDETPNGRLLALIMAADHQRLEVIDQLLAAGTPIDATDAQWRRQPLRLAAQNGRADSVRHLLARGADPTLKDDDGRTALELCGPEHRSLPNPGQDEVAAILAAATPSQP